MLQDKTAGCSCAHADTIEADPLVAEETCGTSHGPACRETPPARCGKEAGHFGEHYCGACGTVFT